VSKLIYETGKAQDYYKQIKQLKVPKDSSTFEDFYKQIKNERIKPQIDKE